MLQGMFLASGMSIVVTATPYGRKTRMTSSYFLRDTSFSGTGTGTGTGHVCHGLRSFSKISGRHECTESAGAWPC